MNLRLLVLIAIATEGIICSSSPKHASSAGQLDGKKLTISLQELAHEYVNDGINWDRDWTPCHPKEAEDPENPSLVIPICTRQQQLPPELINKVGKKVLYSIVQSHRLRMQKGNDGVEDNKKEPAKHALNQVIPAMRAVNGWESHGKNQQNVEWFSNTIGNFLSPACLLDTLDAFDLWPGPVSWVMEKSGRNIYNYVLHQAKTPNWVQEHIRGIRVLIEAFPADDLRQLIQQATPISTFILAQNASVDKYTNMVVSIHGDKLINQFSSTLLSGPVENLAPGESSAVIASLEQLEQLSPILSHSILTWLLLKTKDQPEKKEDSFSIVEPEYVPSKYGQFMLAFPDLHVGLCRKPGVAAKLLSIPPLIGPNTSSINNLIMVDEAVKLLIREAAMPRVLWDLLYGWARKQLSSSAYLVALLRRPFELKPQSWPHIIRILAYGWREGKELDLGRFTDEVFSNPAFGPTYLVHLIQSEVLSLQTIDLSEVAVKNGQASVQTNVDPARPVPAFALLIEPAAKYPWVVDCWAIALRSTKPSSIVHEHLLEVFEKTRETHPWWSKLKGSLFGEN